MKTFGVGERDSLSSFKKKERKEQQSCFQQLSNKWLLKHEDSLFIVGGGNPRVSIPGSFKCDKSSSAMNSGFHKRLLRDKTVLDLRNM